MPFFCQRCGTGLPPSARFCSNCGNVVTAAPPAPGRPLVRPIAGRQIAGVCIGVAQANGWDVTLVRILTVVGFLFTSGLVGIAYLAGWIGIPEETVPMPGPYPSGIPGNYPPGPYPPNASGGYPPRV
jgi:phage shock protein C